MTPIIDELEDLNPDDPDAAKLHPIRQLSWLLYEINDDWSTGILADLCSRLHASRGGRIPKTLQGEFGQALSKLLNAVDDATALAKGMGSHLEYGLADPGKLETIIRAYLREVMRSANDVDRAIKAADRNQAMKAMRDWRTGVGSQRLGFGDSIEIHDILDLLQVVALRRTTLQPGGTGLAAKGDGPMSGRAGAIAATTPPVEDAIPTESTAPRNGASAPRPSLNKNEAPPEKLQLRPCAAKAWMQYQYAISQDASLAGSTDHDVHTWLLEHSDDDEHGEVSKLASFCRYLREARSFHDQRKHNPRAGRPVGKSIIRSDQQ